jgi:hypothetical protein
VNDELTQFRGSFDTVVRLVVQLQRENVELRAIVDAVPVEAMRKLRAHLSTDGEYSICRSDKEPMFIGDSIVLGTLFEAIDKWLEANHE